MREAKISEIFLSLQGEGIYMGIPQLFIRFYGCNLSCAYCDTNFDSHKTFAKDSLISKILEYKKPYHSISLTGGEPLLQADFIRDFLIEYKKSYKKLIYLETNGTLHKELPKVIDYVDIIAMDFKFSSSTRSASFFEEHEKFIKIAKEKKVFIKAIIAPKTKAEEIQNMMEIVKKVGRDIPVVLQPVDSVFEEERPNTEILDDFRSKLKKTMNRVEVIPQIHKILDIR